MVRVQAGWIDYGLGGDIETAAADNDSNVDTTGAANKGRASGIRIPCHCRAVSAKIVGASGGSLITIVRAQ